MKALLIGTVVASAGALALGLALLSVNSLDTYAIPALLLVGLCFLTLFVYRRRSSGRMEWTILGLWLFALALAGVRLILPEYLYAFKLNAIAHRSLFSAVLVISAALPGTMYSLFHLCKGTPKAYDISRYPLLALPGFLAMALYCAFIFQIIAKGTPHLNWSILSSSFAWQTWKEMVWKDGWPVWVSHSLQQAGMRNYILGTLLLVGMTIAIALPIGVAVGVYTSEYSAGRLAKTMRFSTQVLRAISVLILAILAYNLAARATGTFLSDLVTGYYVDATGTKHFARGSFITAAFFIALLIIPVIAKSTEEGLLSLPRDILEGSRALGASLDYTITRIALPWSVPNIITGTVLGAAEAAGSLAIILFMGGTGEYGLSPLNGVTSLTYLIFDIQFGRDLGSMVPKLMASYQITAALVLLIITLGLTVIALIVKQNLSKKYKGA